MSHSILISDLKVVTAKVASSQGEQRALRGAKLRELKIFDHADIWIEDGKIQRIVDRQDPEQLEQAEIDLAMKPEFKRIDGSGKTAVPGFIDCHTHSLWAGNRVAEWEAKLMGKDYLETLKEGGGILSTVRAIRKSSVEQLTENLLTQLWKMLRNGTTTVEVKSGYGLDTENEIKMLTAIAEADQQWPGKVFATACIGHAIDPDVGPKEFFDRTINETLPEVHRQFPGVAIDGYCEDGSWDLEQTMRLCEAAKELGHPVRMHADQFNDLGVIPRAVENGFVSVDHLEASSEENLSILARSETFGVALPCSGFHLNDRFADCRRFIDQGGKLAIASNNNPGSAPCCSMPMTIALACRYNGISVAEALNACTHNAAQLLSYAGNRSGVIGRIEPGMRADLAILDTTDYRNLGYQFGGNPVGDVICGGREI